MRTLGELVREVRTMLNDPTPSGVGSTYSGTVTLRVLGDIIIDARGQLNDIDPANYRYPEVDLYIYIGNALLLLRRFRPDLFETGSAGALPRYTPSNAATPFPVDETYYTAFVQYVIASAEMRDDTTAQEQKATLLATGFMANLQGSPFRYADALLYGFVTDAVGEARRVRPDLFHGRMRTAWPAYTPADAGTAFPFDERFYLPTLDFVLGRAKARNADSPIKGPGPTDYTDMFAKRLMAA